MLNSIIVEDERIAANRLEMLIYSVSNHIKVIGKYDGIDQTIAHLEMHGMPDVIFLDIHLSDGNAFTLFEMADITCPVIFTTAYTGYTQNAFKLNAADYLLKPIKKNDLLKSLGKLSKQVTSEIYLNTSDTLEQRKFIIRFGNKYYVTPSNEIAYVYNRENMTILVRKDGVEFPLSLTISEMEKELVSRDFIRINKNFIIHIDAISHLQYIDGNPVISLRPKYLNPLIIKSPFNEEFQAWINQQYA